MAVSADMSARQRKHIYMHSTIFEANGPAPRSVYAPSRQHELYNNFSDKLGTVNKGRQPELDMPTALDMKTTHNAGHNAVLPGGSQDVVKANTSRMGREVVVHDGEAAPVVKAAEKERETIPKEFWATSTTLQWHDTRNERCRSGNQVDRQSMAAQELKRQELSSEMFGKARLTEPSDTKASARKQLMPDSADYLRLDSSLHAPKPGQSPTNGQEARSRLHQNLASSVHNTMPAPEHDQQGPIQVPPQGDDPSNMPRRRQEKNFSDLFGAQMGERKEVRGHREEVTGTQTLSFLDPRCEIANRNKEHWRGDEVDSPTRRKEVECESTLFDHACPDKPAVAPEREQVLRSERTVWDSKACFEATSETARRRRMKDHLGDFSDRDGNSRTHASRKQESLASSQMRAGIGAPPEVHEAWAATMPEPPRSLAAGGYGRTAPPTEREALMRSAKDVKLASLQSSIFS